MSLWWGVILVPTTHPIFLKEFKWPLPSCINGHGMCMWVCLYSVEGFELYIFFPFRDWSIIFLLIFKLMASRISCLRVLLSPGNRVNYSSTWENQFVLLPGLNLPTWECTCLGHICLSALPPRLASASPGSQETFLILTLNNWPDK